MSSGFVPSLQKESGKGFRIVHGAYPDGVAGVKLSLETIAQHIRAGAKSALVQGWAYDQLLACGLKGRDGPPPLGKASNFSKASCLLDAIRKVTIYTADPPNVEMVKSAEAQLCLRPGLCIRGGDCDDQTVLFGAVVMSVGIPARVLKQAFGGLGQEHVLVEFQDDNGSWIPADPSTDLPIGQKYPASEEWTMDPSNPSMIGLHGAPEAEFVGIGRVERFLGTVAPKLCKCHGKCGPCKRGLAGVPRAGLPPRTIGAVSPLPTTTLPQSGPFTQSAADFQSGVILPIQAGDAYYNAGQYADAITAYKAAGQTGATTVGPEIDLSGAAAVTQKFTQNAWVTNAELQKMSDTYPTSDAKKNADMARWDVFIMFLLYKQALAAGQTAMARGGTIPGSTPNVSFLQAGMWGVGGGIAAGIIWEWAKPHVQRHARRWR